MVDQAELSLRMESAATLDCQERASTTAALIDKLNIRTQAEERPDSLFSAQEEPEAAQ